MALPDPVVLAFYATVFTWAMTSLGAMTVLLGAAPGRRTLDGMLGFTAGVMLAASYWSLLAPAIERTAGPVVFQWVPAAVGFALGAALIGSIDRLLPHAHFYAPEGATEGLRTSWRRTTLLVAAVALHNLPEGLAIGVAFGSIAPDGAGLAAAVALALGIGIQDLAEGAAVAVPLRRLGLGRGKAFFIGQWSGFLQVVAGVAGAVAVQSMGALLPYALAFAAGAMVFVVVEDVIPEAQANGNIDVVSAFTVVGFVVMMALDVSAG